MTTNLSRSFEFCMHRQQNQNMLSKKSADHCRFPIHVRRKVYTPVELTLHDATKQVCREGNLAKAKRDALGGRTTSICLNNVVLPDCDGPDRHRHGVNTNLVHGAWGSMAGTTFAAHTKKETCLRITYIRQLCGLF